MTIARSFPALSVLLAASAALSDTVVVTTGFDDIDIDWQTATIADLPGPDGKVSFSEAMIATNNTPGHDRIEFAIPQREWQLQFLFPGRAVVKAINTFFWARQRLGNDRRHEPDRVHRRHQSRRVGGRVLWRRGVCQWR